MLKRRLEIERKLVRKVFVFIFFFLPLRKIGFQSKTPKTFRMSFSPSLSFSFPPSLSLIPPLCHRNGITILNASHPRSARDVFNKLGRHNNGRVQSFQFIKIKLFSLPGVLTLLSCRREASGVDNNNNNIKNNTRHPYAMRSFFFFFKRHCVTVKTKFYNDSYIFFFIFYFSFVHPPQSHALRKFIRRILLETLSIKFFNYVPARFRFRINWKCN